MSFYVNNTNPNRPGPISGNPLGGICEKVMIETTKVFDACVSQTTETGIVLVVDNLSPASPALPLTYVSAQSSTTESASIVQVTIDRVDQAPNYANVSATIEVPVVVNYRDANGVSGTGTSTITVQKDVMLFVPQPSLSPISITATALFQSGIGTFNGDNTFTVTGCLQIMLKVTSVVDLLLPSYGYPVVPPCQAVSSPSACPGLGDLPLYPTASTAGNIIAQRT